MKEKEQKIRDKVCDKIKEVASNVIDKADGANFLLTYADSTTGNTVSTDFNTMTNSVFYTNPLTDQIEHHYFVKEVEDGVQIYYTIGEFSAGSSYFPQRIYQTIYKIVLFTIKKML